MTAEHTSAALGRVPLARTASATAEVLPHALRQSRPAWERRYARLLPVVDGVLLLGVVLAVQSVATSFPQLSIPRSAAPLAVCLALGWLGALAVSGAYESRILGHGSDEYKRTLTATWHYAALLAIGSYVAQNPALRGFLVTDVLIGGAALLLGRQTVRRFVWARRRQGFALHRLVVVGPAYAASEVIREVGRRDDTGFRVVGVCASGVADDKVTRDLDEVGGFDDIIPTIIRTGADTVAVVGSAEMPTGFIRQLAWQLEGTGVDLMVSPAITDVAGPRIHIRPVANLSLLYVESPQFTGPTRLAKATFDRVVAGVLAVLLLPLLALIAVGVKLSSPGPVLFRQTRVGFDGRLFRIIKFRTMHDGPPVPTALNEADGQLFKVRQDPRVTRFGRFLRTWSLDELPQLVNVLAGSMSLVGPRPLPVDAEDFAADERRRLLVKPGMTGLWQVSGRSDLTWDESVRLDLYYVENWSLAFDAVILLRTVAVVLRRHGAY